MIDESDRRTCVVTGANSGLGLALTHALAHRGHRVIMVCRSRTRGEQARSTVKASTPGAQVELVLADISSIRDVHLAARRIAELDDRVHVLVNNAGAVFERRALSADGFEMHWATNFLGAFALTHGLWDQLEAAAGARVVNLTSMTRRFAPLDPDGGRLPDPERLFRSYGRAKRAMAAFSAELALRLEPAGGQAWAFDPGLVRTGIGAALTGFRARGWALIDRWAVEPEAAAVPLVDLVTAPRPAHPPGSTVVRGDPMTTEQSPDPPDVRRRLWSSALAAVEEATAGMAHWTAQ